MLGLAMCIEVKGRPSYIILCNEALGTLPPCIKVPDEHQDSYLSQ